MSILFLIIISTLLIASIALIGVSTLFLKEKLLNQILLMLVSFSAGSLMGGAFLHLLPEAIAKVRKDKIFNLFLFLIFGFCTFFVLEHFVKWHHHHTTSHAQILPFSYLILISDAIHNFIDGFIIAVSFMVSCSTGLVTSLAVGLHEIPQEIGDFGILVYGGFKKKKALLLNFLSASPIIIGGVIGFFISGKIGENIIYLLPFAAGSFIYIAATDLIPEMRHKENFSKSFINFTVFLLGIGIMWLIKLFY